MENDPGLAFEHQVSDLFGIAEVDDVGCDSIGRDVGQGDDVDRMNVGALLGTKLEKVCDEM